jgi:FkbM family methyltransferase
MLIDFRQLFPKWRINPKGVLHVGANVGEEAPVYDELKIPKVMWIEANPDIFETLKANVAKYENQFALNECIGDVNGEEVLFHVSNNGSQSSSILELGTHKIAHPEVHYVKDIPMQTRRLDYIFSANDNPEEPFYDFLNLDLQGAELKALRGMGDLLYQFKWIYSEVNQAELYKGCPHVNDLDLFLNAFKFKRVETKWCGNTGWGDALYIKGR